MFVGQPPGNYDRLLDFSRAVTGALFFVPSATFLETSRQTDRPRRRAASRRAPTPRPSSDGSLGIGSLKERQTHEQSPSRARADLRRRLGANRAGGDAHAQASSGGAPGRGRRRARRARDFSAVGTGHIQPIEAPSEGVQARAARVEALVELRVPFELVAIRRSTTSSAAPKIRTGTPLEGGGAKRLPSPRTARSSTATPPAGIQGIRPGASNPAVTLPVDVRELSGRPSPQAVSELRLAGVEGPYTLVLGADPYTAVCGGSEDGYPVSQHLQRLVDGDIVWAPGHRRRARADDARRRLRAAPRAGLLHRLSEPHRRRPSACTCRRASPSGC